jgi:hypothetical protein
MYNTPQFQAQHGPGYGAPPEWAGDPLLGGLQMLAGSINENIRQLFGVRLDRNEEFAWLTFDTTPLTVVTGATNVRGIMTVGQESDFVAVGIVARAVDPTATPPVALAEAFRYLIRDGSTNRELQRNNLPGSFLGLSTSARPAGTAPMFLPKPRIFSRNSNVIWLLDNNQGINIAVDIAFFGYRIYDVDALDLTKTRG